MTRLVEASELSDLARACLDRYDLGHVEMVGELSGGMFARPLLLQTSHGRRVLRIHTFRGSEAAFQFQAETIEWACQRGIPCARVQPTSAGDWCVSLPAGQGAAALHHYVDGSPCDWHAWQLRKEKEPGFLENLGRQVGRLHQELATAQPGGDPQLPTQLPTIQFHVLDQIYGHWQQAFRRLATQQHLACTAAQARLCQLEPRIDSHWQRLLARAEQLQVAALPRQIVHGDISAVNLVWSSQVHAAIIDWDTVHYGHRLYDALGDVLHRVPEDRPEWNQYRQDHIAQYLAGYSAALDNPLSGQELRLVPTFSLARQLEDLRQRVAALPTLPAQADRQYATLIDMRVDMMDQIDLSNAA